MTRRKIFKTMIRAKVLKPLTIFEEPTKLQIFHTWGQKINFLHQPPQEDHWNQVPIGITRKENKIDKPESLEN